MVMKKWKVSELFSQLDIPTAELPEISNKEEISYKSVQKRVFAQLDSREVITMEPEKKIDPKRFLLGFGIAAALIAGGVGAYGASNAGSRVEETPTHATIDSKPMTIITGSSIAQTKASAFKTETETKSEEEKNLPPEQGAQTSEKTDILSSSVSEPAETVEIPIQQEAQSYYPPEQTYEELKEFWRIRDYEIDPSKFREPYDVKITDNMDVADITDVKVCTDGTISYIMYTIQTYLPEGVSALDADFGWFFPSSQYGGGSGTYYVLDEYSDDDTLCIVSITTNRVVNADENAFHVNIDGCTHKDAEYITELGMKNLLGFTGAEIAAKKPFSEEQLAIINEEYALEPNGSNYLKKEDLFSYDDIEIYIDPSEKEFPVGINNPENAVRTMLYSGGIPAPENMPIISNDFSLINAQLHSIIVHGYNAEIIMKYTPQNEFAFTGNEDVSIFYSAKIQPYTLNENGERDYFIDTITRSDTWVDVNGLTNGGEQCMYHKIEVSAVDMQDVYVRLSLDTLHNPSDQSVIENGQIMTDIYIGDFTDLSLEDYSIKDSFTTEDGFNIDLCYEGPEVKMEWQGTSDNYIPDFMKTCSRANYGIPSDDKTVAMDDVFTLVLENGYRYRVRMNLHVDENYNVVLTTFVPNYFTYHSELQSIEFDGKTIYTNE